MNKAALRGFVVGLLALLAALVPATASADPSSGFGPFGPEILSNPVPGPVLPVPNVFPLPPPLPTGTGLAPAPVLPGPHTFPVPAPVNGVQDGPGSGPVVPPPVQIDAGKPAEGTNPGGGPAEPVGKRSRVDDKYLARHGVDAHRVKEENDLRPPSRFDIYLDREGNMYGVRKGDDPKFGEPLGHIDDV